jgi:hypothetical protein
MIVGNRTIPNCALHGFACDKRRQWVTSFLHSSLQNAVHFYICFASITHSFTTTTVHTIITLSVQYTSRVGSTFSKWKRSDQIIAGRFTLVDKHTNIDIQYRGLCTLTTTYTSSSHRNDTSNRLRLGWTKSTIIGSNSQQVWPICEINTQF